jgi:hypothetical protein
MRTLTQIKTDLETSAAAAIPGLSTSSAAGWRLWVNVFATAVWTFEGLLDLFKAEITDLVRSKQNGTLEWYYDRIKEFQGGTNAQGQFTGDTLIIDTSGIVRYQTPDPARQIIAQVSLSEAGGGLFVRIAKRLNTSDLQPIAADELLALQNYIDNVKLVGTAITIINANADVIRYNIEAFYNSLYAPAVVTANIQAKLNEYRATLKFSASFDRARFTAKLLEAEGIETINIDAIEGRLSAGAFAAIDTKYALNAGYFNYDPDSQLTLTVYNPATTE